MKKTDTANTAGLDGILAQAYTRQDATRALLTLEDTQGASVDTRELANALKHIPTLVLYAPIPLTRASIQAVGEWCRREISPNLLLEIKVDGRMTGGCAFAWNGVFYDYSLSYFLEKRAAQYQALISRVIGSSTQPDIRHDD